MKVLITEDEIKNKVRELASAISEKYNSRKLFIICVLKGSFVFAADLIREIENVDLRVDFVRASSYGLSTVTSGEVKILYEPSISFNGEDVLIVDDILDTGFTLDRIKRWAVEKGARSVEVCVLLDKPERREVDFEADYVGFKIPNVFVVGYGLDAGEKYRHLKHIAIFEEE